MQENHGPRSRPQRPMFDQEGAGSAQGGASGGVPRINDAYPERLGSDVPRRPQGGGGGRPPAGGRRPPRKKKPVSPKQRRRRRIALITVGSLLLVMVVGVWAAYKAIDNEIRDNPDQVEAMPEDIKTAAIPEYTGKNIVTALIMGIDYNNDTADGYEDPTDKIGNTDLIMYLMFDTSTGKANVLQIPRDMYVGEDVETGGIAKINGLYQHSPNPQDRVGALANVIYDQLKLPIDFYVTLDMDAVKAIVAHKEFVQVFVPHTITDAETGNLLISEGWQNITEQEVEYLLRNRNYPDGDITRMRTQMSFYSALFREFKQLAPMDLVMWMRIFVYYAKIGGIGTMQLGGLAQKALNITGEDLTFVRPAYSGAWYIPESGALEGKQQSMVCLVPEDTADLLNEYFRPEGAEVPVEELDIHTLEVNEYGIGEHEVRTMTDIQEVEPEIPSPW